MDIKSVIKKNLILNWIYKIQKIYKNKKPNFHYGEFAEDIFINRVFKNLKSGFYIDIGAYHPFKGSLTFLLFQKKYLNIAIQKNILLHKSINHFMMLLMIRDNVIRSFSLNIS